MDTKQIILRHMEENSGTRYSPEQLAMEINGSIILDLNVNPDEVLKFCSELAAEKESVKHFSRERGNSVFIAGEPRTLYLDQEYLLYDVVAEYATERVEEVEDLNGEQLRDWIRDELVEYSEGSVIEHEFEFEN